MPVMGRSRCSVAMRLTQIAREGDLATGLLEADLETRVGPDCLRGMRELTGCEPAFPLQVGAERVGLAAAAEVGEDAMGAGAGEADRDGPAAGLGLLGMEVLEAA